MRTFVSDLPGDLPATVLVALHLSHEAPSLLSGLLQRRSDLEVLPAQDGLELSAGRVIVAVPDRHLLVVDDRIVLGRGARDNGHRPAHDAMLRSAALLRGPAAVGVVLTGLLDDGSAGLRAVDRYGGTCLVQDPADAMFQDMPLNALRAVPTASRVPLARLADEVVRVVYEEPASPQDVAAGQRTLDLAELSSSLGGPAQLPDGRLPGGPSRERIDMSRHRRMEEAERSAATLRELLARTVDSALPREPTA